MKNAYLYCYQRDLNDATRYYVNLVNESLKREGYDIKQVFSLKEIKKPDLIFTITCMCFAKAKLRFPFVKTISWIQGAMFEEVTMNQFKALKRYAILATEFMTIKMADLLIFVSERLCEYYDTKFGYKKTNYVIVPCYNCHLNDTVNLRKFDSPTFVYAGSTSRWQSIDVILDTFAMIESSIPKASLTMYCKDSSSLRNMIKERGIKNVQIKYVTVETLQVELLQYKYGFILRESNWVNAVSTPTKMNSYLSGYVIPIFSDAVDSFKRHINLGSFALMTETPLSSKDISSMIIEFENEQHNYQDFISKSKALFNTYYNDDLNIKKIECATQKYIK